LSQAIYLQSADASCTKTVDTASRPQRGTGRPGYRETLQV